MYDKAQARDLVSRITPIDRSLRNDGSLAADAAGRQVAHNAIVVARHSIYSYRTSENDQVACVRAAVEKLPEGEGRRAHSVLRRCGLDPGTPADWGWWARPELLTVDALGPMRAVLRSYADGARDLTDAMLDAVQQIRRRVGRAHLPNAALVIVDEAHNLKSAASTVYSALLDVLDRQFDALLFLTATPFQLGRHELLHIVDFFRASRRHTGNEEAFARRRHELADAMDGYVETLDRFGEAWSDLDAERARAVRDHVVDGPATTDPLVIEAAEAFGRARNAKARLEGAMRPFVLRSTRERHHLEHGPVQERYLTEEARIPLALVDRLLVETMRDSRTFISSALVSACSSWEALRAAAVMSEEGRPRSHTRAVLWKLAEADLLGDHPKVAQTVDECVTAVMRGEKTLVFVEREETGRRIRDAILRQLERLTPDELVSVEAQLQRLQDRTRFGWPSLRENYLHTLYPQIFAELPTSAQLEAAWRDPATVELWRRVDPVGDKRDFAREKRFWEHVLFKAAVTRKPDWRAAAPEDLPNLATCVDRLLESDYILNGLDLRSGVTNERIRCRRNRHASRRASRAGRSPMLCSASAPRGPGPRRRWPTSDPTIGRRSSTPRPARSPARTSAPRSRRSRWMATRPGTSLRWTGCSSTSRVLGRAGSRPSPTTRATRCGQAKAISRRAASAA